MPQWPESLTTAQQAMITAYMDQIFRPVILRLVVALSACNDQIIPGALASPTGESSTIGSPAADCVLGLLGTLTSTDTIPFSTSLPTGFSLAQPLTVASAISFIQ